MKAPDCPLCGHPPVIIVGTTQAFCEQDTCEVFVWNPTLTPAENLQDAKVIDL